jgi:L-aminopeptidase/D-esterase-like protein
MTQSKYKQRARDLGLSFNGIPGSFNAITDITGVEIGFSTLIQGEGPVEIGNGPIRTGVTVILPRAKRDQPSPIWPENAVFSEITGRETGSIIVIIGTDLPLLPIQLRRVAKRAAIGIGRTGTPGGNYSGDIFLAFSIANDIELPDMVAEQPVNYALNYINDHYFDDICGATVEAVEEAIVNAMIAAESMTTIKPAGYTVEAIDHKKLIAIMKQYNRLNE